MTNDYVRVGKIFRRLICAMNALHGFRRSETLNAVYPSAHLLDVLCQVERRQACVPLQICVLQIARTYCVDAHNHVTNE